MNRQLTLRFRKFAFLIGFILLLFSKYGFAESALQTQTNTNDFKSEAILLLSRLNLEGNGLEKVKENQNVPEKAVKELLNYYKNRKWVKHLVDRSAKKPSLGHCASENDIKVAKDALKHIFVGQSAYPPYFCGDDINWNTRPVPDNEWVWQLNRMYFWDAMARAYWHTGDEKYAKEWGAQLIDWTQKNPNDEEHKYAWRSIEAGIRGHSWTNLFQYFIDSPSFTPEVLVAFLNSCYDHAEYLMTQYRSKSNWGLMEAEGMSFIAITFPEFQNALKWRTEAIRRLNNEINLQVYPDGHQRELAIGYHLGCIQWFMRTYELAKLNNLENAFPESYLKTIELMCEVPMKIGLPDGTNAQFGDAWAGKPGQHKEQFQEWAKMFHRDDFLYLATGGQKGHKPDSTAYALPYSGIYSMRSGWDKDAVCLVLKCGPNGGGHCQPDNGTFTLYAGGRTLMPDAGSYIYSGDPENRAWFRQTKVHQTLTLNGKNSQYAPKLLLWKPGDNLDILVVENQSYEKLAHRRSVFFVDKKYFVVVDQAFGKATGDVDIHFQLAPGGGDAIFNRVNNSVRSDFKKGWNIFVRTNPQKGLKLEEEEGQVSFEYTKKEPRPAFRYRLIKNAHQNNIHFITLVAPYKNEVPNIQIKLVGKIPSNGNLLQLEITENGKTKNIGYSF
jgi:heparan-sulfate lyase